MPIPVLGQQGPVTFTQLQDSMQSHPRRIVIEIYTDWCSYCRMQDIQIRKTPALQQLLNEKYYFIRLNAEDPTPLTLNDTTYTFIRQGNQGIHALAARLIPPPVAYPAWVVLDTSYQVQKYYTGFLKSRDLLLWLGN
ncbi:thioredoxin family protein [Chitinophaga rhizophila]|uniref:Thioredoxin family protein n=1 Tax=Chitinophaga rhizophila TaxID=2866212 RepID=A0ABS7GKJ2_9BACT|nr:thioredoxin family protein [Chitinophaga rhizophila]MBW8688237.1 thioredoxin family protein [Chitinophaga rhizophila]